MPNTPTTKCVLLLHFGCLINVFVTQNIHFQKIETTFNMYICHFRNNKMGNIWATADLSDDFVHELINETGFTRKQINRLYIRFRHLDKAKKGYLVKKDLAIVPAVRFSILTKIFLLYHSALF